MCKNGTVQVVAPQFSVVDVCDSALGICDPVQRNAVDHVVFSRHRCIADGRRMWISQRVSMAGNDEKCQSDLYRSGWCCDYFTGDEWIWSRDVPIYSESP